MTDLRELSTASTPQRWAVVGGGFMGMTLALRLAQRGHDVTLFERSSSLGGLASTWKLGPVEWDRHYHVTIRTDSALLRLLEELGLADEVVWAQTRTGCYSGGTLYSVSNAVEFLRFPALRMVDRFRLGLTIVAASRIRDWRRLERVPVEEWLTRWCGARTFDQFWRPLLRAKLGENYRRTSAAFIWAVIQRLYGARGRGMKREQFGYVAGGYARVLDVLDTTLRSVATVRTDAEVAEIRRAAGRVEIRLGDGSTDAFDRLVTTVPCGVIAATVPELDPAVRRRLEGVEYQGVICASVLLRRPLAGFYLTNITDDGLPFTGVVEMTALVDRAAFGGRTLVYLPRYVTRHDPVRELDDDTIRREFLAGLARMHPDLRDGDVLAFRVSRVANVQPVPVVGYSRTIPPMRSGVDGVAIVNSAQIVNGTLNVNEIIEHAESAVAVIDDSAARDAGRVEAVA